jgi:hypothetical protein
MAYADQEKETTCVYDYATKEWNIYTCVPTHMTKLSKIAEPYWKEEEMNSKGSPRMIAGKWRLQKSQVRFAKIIERLAEDDEDENETDAESTGTYDEMEVR